MMLKASPLSAQAFAAFGEVIEVAGHSPQWINQGTSQRFDDLAHVDVLAQGGRPLISIFRATARALPFEVRALERHPLSSQSFFPLDRRPFLVVVAQPAQSPLAAGVQAFLSSGQQGVSYRRNTWHHALLALEQNCDFLVIDRGGPGPNCQEAPLDEPVLVDRG
jgi:ureidoglycolate lyase